MELTRKQQQIRDGYRDMSPEEQRIYDAETREYLASLPRRMERTSSPGLDEYQHEAGLEAEARYHYDEACKSWPSEEARVESKQMLILEDEESRFEAELASLVSSWDEEGNEDVWRSAIERTVCALEDSGNTTFTRRSVLRFVRSFCTHPLDVLDVMEAAAIRTAEYVRTNT